MDYKTESLPKKKRPAGSCGPVRQRSNHCGHTPQSSDPSRNLCGASNDASQRDECRADEHHRRFVAQSGKRKLHLLHRYSGFGRSMTRCFSDRRRGCRHRSSDKRASSENSSTHQPTHERNPRKSLPPRFAGRRRPAELQAKCHRSLRVFLRKSFGTSGFGHASQENNGKTLPNIAKYYLYYRRSGAVEVRVLNVVGNRMDTCGPA